MTKMIPFQNFAFLLPHYGNDFINVCRIITVEKHINTLQTNVYGITIPWDVIEALYKCVFDSSVFDSSVAIRMLRQRYGFARIQEISKVCININVNIDKTIFDMQYIFNQLITTESYYNYLAPNSYGAAYINGIDYPHSINEQEYAEKLHEIVVKKTQEWEQKWENEWANWGKKITEERLLSEVSSRNENIEILLEEEHKQYLQRKQLQNKSNLENEINEAQLEFAYNLKLDYYLRARQYIYAMKYRETLEKHDILKRLGQDVKMYSTDTLGWTNFIYPISEDVKIGVHTNFGYGVASYFRIVLVYKDIPILPYSLYVHYYYANSRDLARYTRSYDPLREHWDDSFSFVVETANMAEVNPCKFIKEWVMHEVEDMITGLRGIMTNPQSYISTWLSAIGTQTKSPYLHVRSINESEKEEYECYPNEMTIDFKAKKISGALDFLESLKALIIIYSDVENAIATIKSLAVKVVPEISNAIDGILADIEKLKKLRAAWVRRQEKLQKRITFMDKEISDNVARILALSKSSLNTLEKKQVFMKENESYRNAHPEYDQHISSKSWCMRRIPEIDCDIQARNKFKEDLVQCREKITTHAAIQGLMV